MQPSSPAWRWEKHATLPSTQITAQQAARDGDPGRLAILANAQTAGRGSRGRAWASPAGNLHLSVLLRPEQGLIDPGRWALLSALSLHEALSPYADGLTLKWPNDVLLHGCKVAGILIDSQLGEAGFVVIGFGANLADAPNLSDRPTARLPAPAPSAEEVAARILPALDGWTERTMSSLVDAWLARAHPIGTLLDVRTRQRRIQGAFDGLTDMGELRIRGQAPISSGEVFLA